MKISEEGNPLTFSIVRTSATRRARYGPAGRRPCQPSLPHLLRLLVLPQAHQTGGRERWRVIWVGVYCRSPKEKRNKEER